MSVDLVNNVNNKIHEMPVNGIGMKICACLPVVSHVVAYIKRSGLLDQANRNRGSEDDSSCDDLSELANTMWYWSPVQMFTSGALLSLVAPSNPYAFAGTLLYNVLHFRETSAKWRIFSYDALSASKKAE